MHTHTLYDADTAELIGPATAEQVEASNEAADYHGVILIDADDDPVPEGTWDAEQPGVRHVYTMPTED